ncbi:MAG: hypothetical protein D6806_01420 [Deltaproteobacteria bacterium]|nr:MAG: hypothetical protein D6806_01420 [Deltaproteobacteria bacterium]
MTAEADQVKQEVKEKSSGKGTRYTEEQKKQLLEKFNELCKQGKNVLEAAKEVGVSYVTLRKWGGKKSTARRKKAENKAAALKKALKPRKRKTTKKKKAAKKKAAAKTAAYGQQKGNLVLVTPRGYRIEGISASDLIKVLKELK